MYIPKIDVLSSLSRVRSQPLKCLDPCWRSAKAYSFDHRPASRLDYPNDIHGYAGRLLVQRFRDALRHDGTGLNVDFESPLGHRFTRSLPCNEIRGDRKWTSPDGRLRRTSLCCTGIGIGRASLSRFAIPTLWKASVDTICPAGTRGSR